MGVYRCVYTGGYRGVYRGVIRCVCTRVGTGVAGSRVQGTGFRVQGSGADGWVTGEKGVHRRSGP